MIILDATTKSLITYMEGAHTTNAPTFVTAYLDIDATTELEGSLDGVLNGSNQVTIVAAPASGHRRIIKSLAIHNADTVSHTISVALLNGAGVRLVIPATVLPAGALLPIGMDNTALVGLGSADTPTFNDMILSALSASQAVMTDGSKKLISADYLDQAVKQASSPTFANLTDNGLSVSLPVLTDANKKLVSASHGYSQVVDRGDPAAADYTQASLTINGNFVALDLGLIVPAGATHIIFTGFVNNNTAGQYFQIRKKGLSNQFNKGSITAAVANQSFEFMWIIPCDSSRSVEYRAANGGTWANISLTVSGWILGQ